MSAPMVRAILAGRKTQTRRVVKPKYQLASLHATRDEGVWSATADPISYYFSCPQGCVGDHLWVKETHGIDRRVGGDCGIGYVHYVADDSGAPRTACGKLKPSIFMRRIHSRITLEVTGIRVERLQKISERDAIAEGIERDGDGWRAYVDGHLRRLAFPQNSYKTLWESINGPGSWDANPWVWVVTFNAQRPTPNAQRPMQMQEEAGRAS
jgi:hypothetical protein